MWKQESWKSGVASVKGRKGCLLKAANDCFDSEVLRLGLKTKVVI